MGASCCKAEVKGTEEVQLLKEDSAFYGNPSPKLVADKVAAAEVTEAEVSTPISGTEFFDALETQSLLASRDYTEFLKESDLPALSFCGHHSPDACLGSDHLNASHAHSGAELKAPPSPRASSTSDSPWPPCSLERILSQDPNIKAMSKDFQNGRMLRVRTALGAWCAKHSATREELLPFHKILGFTIPDLDEHCARIEKNLAYFKDERGYTLVKQEENGRLLHKVENGQHSMKMEGLADHPLENALALLFELDLMPSWHNLMTRAQKLLSPSDYLSYNHAVHWMPFPFSNMDCLFTAHAYDLSQEEKSLLISMQSIDNSALPTEASEQLPKGQKHHRVSLKPGSSFMLEALPPKADGTPQTMVTIFLILDPQMLVMPGYVVNTFLGVVAPAIYRQMKRVMDNEFDSNEKPFPRRQAANQSLYQHVRQVVREGMAYHYGNPDSPDVDAADFLAIAF